MNQILANTHNIQPSKSGTSLLAGVSTFETWRFFQWVVLLGITAVLTCSEYFTQSVIAAELEPGIAYVSNEDSGDISVISTQTNEIVATIEVGTRPRGIRLDSGGNFLYVATSGSPKCPPSIPDEVCEKLEVDKSLDGIVKVDLATNKVVGHLPGGSDPEQFDFSADGTLLFVSNEDTGQLSVISTVTGTILKSIDVGREPEGVKVSPDGEFVFVTSESDNEISIINASANNSSSQNDLISQMEVVAQIEVGGRPRDIIFSSDSQFAYVSNEFGTSITVIDVSTQKVTRTIALAEGSLPMGLALSSDNRILYVANGRARTVSKIILANDSVLSVSDIGRRPWGIAITADDKFLYTANGPSDDVTVIETASMTVVTTIKAGESPWGVVIGKNP